MIEQAIFTSAQTERAAGYQLVAQSPGIGTADLRELAAWGPSHDSLLETGADAVSVNFHPLPSGAYCISKTTPGGSEYSGRVGQKVYTQCLVVPADVLARFGNNPFALLTAAFAQGSLRVYEQLPVELQPFRLVGKAGVVDQALLSQLMVDPGMSWLGALLEAAVSSPALAIVAGQQRQRLIAGLINCLPPECRTRFSFTSGLRYSPRRPFRVFCLSDDPAEQRRLVRQSEATLLEFSGKPPKQFTVTGGWGGFVACALAAGKTAFLSGQLAAPRPQLTVADLTALGNRLLEKMALSTAAADAVPPSRAPPASDLCQAAGAGAAPQRPADPAGDLLRADAAHRRFEEPTGSAAALDGSSLCCGPSQWLSADSPEMLETLEVLDDTVFEAIAGKPGAMDRLRALWPKALSRLRPEMVDESREQYLRHALRVWRDCVEGEHIHNPALAIKALDVVVLLFDELPSARESR